MTRGPVLSLLFLLLVGCATRPPLAPELEATAQAEIARRPEFYRNGQARAFLVRKDGRAAGLLWGTIHIPYGEDTLLPAPIRRRFYDAADLSVEVALDRLPAPERERLRTLLRTANQTANADALARLDPATRAQLGRAVGADSLVQFSLRGLATLVAAGAGSMPEQLTPSTGLVDLTLIGFARSMRKPVHGLETPQLPDPTILAPNGQDAADTLRLNLRRADTLPAMRQWVRASYGQGDIAATLAALTAWRALPSDLARADHDRTMLLDDRNHGWLPRLQAILDQPGFHFIAFGAAHLPGDDGIVALLRAAGYQVLPCPQDACPG